MMGLAGSTMPPMFALSEARLHQEPQPVLRVGNSCRGAHAIVEKVAVVVTKLEKETISRLPARLDVAPDRPLAVGGIGEVEDHEARAGVEVERARREPGE